MSNPNEKPVPPWEQEQAAAALAELKQSQNIDKVEEAALKVVDSELLLQQVDRMIADKRADLARMQRLSGPGQNVNTRGLALNELGKPVAIVILLLTIIAIGFALNWMAGKISASISELPTQEGQLTQEQAAPEEVAAPELQTDESELQEPAQDESTDNFIMP